MVLRRRVSAKVFATAVGYPPLSRRFPPWLDAKSWFWMVRPERGAWETSETAVCLLWELVQFQQSLGGKGFRDEGRKVKDIDLGGVYSAMSEGVLLGRERRPDEACAGK